MSLQDNLTEFGLNEKMARVYLAILELGQAKAHEIAAKSGIARPTTYDILQKLSRDGLVGAYEKHKVRYYIANDPEKIKRNYIEKLKTFDTLLPELKSVYNTLRSKPKISYYEGAEGIKIVLEETINASHKNLRGILSMNDLFKTPGRKYMEDYIKHRVSRGYSLQVIRSREKDIMEVWPTSQRETRTVRFAPSTMSFSMSSYLFDNKVGLISSEKENFGMIIESNEYSHNMQLMFDALWQISKPG